jgi:hypothetical protein
MIRAMVPATAEIIAAGVPIFAVIHGHHFLRSYSATHSAASLRVTSSTGM